MTKQTNTKNGAKEVAKAVAKVTPVKCAPTPRTPKVAKSDKLTADVIESQYEFDNKRQRVVTVLVDGYCRPQKQRFVGKGSRFVNGSKNESEQLKNALIAGLRDALVTGGDKDAVKEAGVAPFKWEESVKASITFNYAIPRGREDLINSYYRGHIVDLSNLQKLVEDAIQGHLLADDAQLVQITTRKKYAEKNGVCIELQNAH